MAKPKKDSLDCATDPGIVDVIETSTFKLKEKVKPEDGAHTLTFNPKNQQFYVFLPKSCDASVYSED